MAVPPAPVRVPSEKPLALSVASVTLVANDKGDNEMILGVCTDLLAFALQPRKTSARRQADERAVRPAISSNGVPFLQMRMRSVGLHSTSGGEKERMGSDKITPRTRHSFEILMFSLLVKHCGYLHTSSCPGPYPTAACPEFHVG